MHTMSTQFWHKNWVWQDPDTPEGLESRLSVEILKIPTELPHSTELELGKLHRTEMDSDRASTLELLWGLPRSQEVLQPSEPCLSLYSTKIEFGGPLGGLNLTFFTRSAGGNTVVFIGVRQCSNRRFGVGGSLVRPGGQVSSLHHLWALDTLSTTSVGHVDKTVFGNAATQGRPAKVMWPASHTLARPSPCFVPRHFLVSYLLWQCRILDIRKISIYFGPYGIFPSFDVPKMVNQQNSWKSLVISTYLLYLEWNVGMLVVNICILWLPTTGLSLLRLPYICASRGASLKDSNKDTTSMSKAKSFLIRRLNTRKHTNANKPLKIWVVRVIYRVG
jgi:hypothetical protein